MNKKYLMILCIFFFMGCGSNQDQSALDAMTSVNDESSSIYNIGVGIWHNKTEIEGPTQLYLTVNLKSGEKIVDLTTSFTDPQTNETSPIHWGVSDQSLAFIDDGARLIPAGDAYVMITANLLDKTDSIVVHVINRYVPPLGSTSEDTSDSDSFEETEDNEWPPAGFTTCNGHATAVVSFLPGTGAGFGSSSLPDIVLGPPQGNGDLAGSTHVVSFGTNGEIILDLGECLLADGPGVDLIVFENTFFIGGDPLDPYVELGVVGVSQDGGDFVEFPCSSEEYPYSGCAGWHPVYSSPSNDISPFDIEDAGGDQFDLSEIGVDMARYVRIRDLEGEGFGISIGFDLDAIAIVNGLCAE